MLSLRPSVRENNDYDEEKEKMKISGDKLFAQKSWKFNENVIR